MIEVILVHSIPVTVSDYSYEGETVNDSKLVTVEDKQGKKLKFVLRNEDILAERIEVVVIQLQEDKALVEPIAKYVQHLWSITGVPPRQFWVDSSTLSIAKTKGVEP